ncbi:MAG TPA: RDD family protein [Chitinophagales bacterium]|nr:RDD family protein [Chitinophagales bacterium]
MNYELPTLTDRVKSTIIDTFLILLLMGLVSELFNFFTNVPDWVRITVMIMMILYDPIFTSTTCTLGQKLAGVRVRNFEKLHFEDREERIGFLPATLRIVVKFILGGITVISFFLNNEKRMLQDFASGSIVIKK